jgi:DNA-binding protein
VDRITRALIGSPRRGVVTVGLTLFALFALYVFVPPIRLLGASVTLMGGGAAFLIHEYPNEAKQLTGRALAYLAWANRSIERESVRQDLEGTMSGAVASFARSCPDAVMDRVRIDFVRSQEQVEALPDGTLVLGIAQHRDRTRNLVAAAWAYARHGVLEVARNHLDRDVARGIDFTVARAILGADGDPRAVGEFIRSIWRPAIESESRLREMTAKLESIEVDKLFGPVLLEEFAALGLELVNRLPDPETAAETVAFVEHLDGLATGSWDHDRLNFDGQRIRCGFLPLGTSEVIATKGVGTYVQAAAHIIAEGYPRVYLLARGAHIQVASDVAAELSKDRRVLGTRETSSQIGSTPRVVTQVRVDVREYFGFGQRPIVSVGDAYEQEIAARRRRVGRRKRC